MPNSGQVAMPSSSQIAIAWCLLWGKDLEPQRPKAELAAIHQALVTNNLPKDSQFLQLLEQADTLLGDGFVVPKTTGDLETFIKGSQERCPDLWQGKIGLVYGGVTKVKGYVFESADLQEIRGASGLLDRINLVDLPAFFHKDQDNNGPSDYGSKVIREDWLDKEFPGLSGALIPQLIVYSTGGNILAFCPAAFVDPLANAIEKRYTTETLTANSCAVGRKFRTIETRLGLLPENISHVRWLDWYLDNQEHSLVPQLLGLSGNSSSTSKDIEERFEQQKSFSELVRQLAIDFEQRRNGHPPASDSPRSARCYPPMFETHPYLQRDQSEHRSAVFRAVSKPDDPNSGLPGEPHFSEPSARKRLMGQVTKREFRNRQVPQWWLDSQLKWPSVVSGKKYYDRVNESWIKRFENYLKDEGLAKSYYPTNKQEEEVEEARSLREVADAKRFNGPLPSGDVAFIYADGNNMGGYIRRKIKSPQIYQNFSQDVFAATTQSVYLALYEHLKPRRYKPDASSSRRIKSEIWLYPFEIIAIGGDDVLLVVPADKALEVTETLCELFEQRLQNLSSISEPYTPKEIHRYHANDLPSGKEQGELSMSAGVLITAQNTPFYYAEDLTNQL
ncbi:MAG: type III-B CRISPR-associated protein Cas10/Cmr2, partial [Cyanobacteria bacterium P01_H01_bin.105]